MTKKTDETSWPDLKYATEQCWLKQHDSLNENRQIDQWKIKETPQYYYLVYNRNSISYVEGRGKNN